MTNEPAAAPPIPAEASKFDFWLGDWEVHWGNGLRGTNQITRTLGDRVILEEFDGERDAQLRGMSVSVYEPRDGRWRQTWVDDNGSYYNFVGGWEAGAGEGRGGDADGRMVLVHERSIEGNRVLLRMVWSDIEKDRLTWEWQRSDDGGDTWRTLWRLDYERRSADPS